jgi:hypothetical protein
MLEVALLVGNLVTLVALVVLVVVEVLIAMEAQTLAAVVEEQHFQATNLLVHLAVQDT